ncbi:MAG: hypothetical protein F6J87_12980 [Spirulina sp. SIO3F2]|nr:hypothetical protein [Spirulina sp. SIO3F2]
MIQLTLLPGAIAAILADSAQTQILTCGDRFGLMAALLSENLSEDEHRAIDRLLRAVRRGRIRFMLCDASLH